MPEMPPLGPRDVALILTLLIAVITDLRSQKIYNVLTFPMTVLGMLSAIPLGIHPWDGLAGAAAALLLTLPIEALRVMRMGDVKLLMAVGALTAPGIAVRAVLLSIAANLLYGVAVLAWRGRLGRLLRFYRERDLEPTVVAYAPAIAVATLLARLQPWP